MGMLESVKEKIEKVTGRKRPSRGDLHDAVKSRKPNAFRFKNDGVVPNNPKLPFILYRGPVTLTDDFDPAAVFEELFGRNGWRDSWHNGIYNYAHYPREPTKCSVLRAVMPGFVSAVNAEKSFASRPAMLWSCPAGTGHQRLAASKDLLVVGAYPRPSNRGCILIGVLDRARRIARRLPAIGATWMTQHIGAGVPKRS